QVASNDNGLAPLQHQRDRRAGHDELQERFVKRLALVDRVVLLGQRPANLHQLQPRQAQPLLLEALQDAADQAAVNTVWLEEDQGPFHGISTSLSSMAKESSRRIGCC